VNGVFVIVELELFQIQVCRLAYENYQHLLQMLLPSTTSPDALPELMQEKYARINKSNDEGKSHEKCRYDCAS
jgi:hypothetical protein